MSINPRATVDRMHCRYLADLGAMISVNPVHVARGAWTWQITHRDGRHLFFIDMPERNRSRSRHASVLRAIAMIKESR